MTCSPTGSPPSMRHQSKPIRPCARAVMQALSRSDRFSSESMRDAIAVAISSCRSRTSINLRSKRSADNYPPSWASTNFTETRTRSPALCTVHSRDETDAFDEWYQKEHLPDALQAFGARRAERGWGSDDPCVHIAIYSLPDLSTAETAQSTQPLSHLPVYLFSRVSISPKIALRDANRVDGDLFDTAMPLHRFLTEFQCFALISVLRDRGTESFFVMASSALQVFAFSTDLRKNFADAHPDFDYARSCWVRFLWTSDANNRPKLCHQPREDASLTQMPRS